MRLPQSPVWQQADWDFGTAPAGPAMSVLSTIIARIAAILRAIALAEVLVQVIIWHSFYLARPWLLWGPAVAIAWSSAAIAYLRRRRPPWQLVCADTAVYAALALGAAWCVPPAMRGEAGSWLFILLASQIVTPIWFAPRALSAPLAFTPGVAFAVGTALAPATGLVTGNPRRASLVLLFALVAVHWFLRRTLSGRAMRADAELAAADRDAREQYVILSRNIERREQDRLLHDTVLNTLTAISRSGSAGAVIDQCRQDIAMLERALSESGGVAPAGRPAAGPAAAIEAVVSQMRIRGLTVDLAVDDGAMAEADGAQAPGPVPAPVAAAIAHATREALANVAEHAGTGKAWVTVSVTLPGDAAAAGLLTVVVQDAGAGFDPGRVDSARLGVRRSITERVEDWGGSASVQSAPGEGTVVCLSWPAARPGVDPPAALKAVGVGTGPV
jgi:signal transduction histidine kinase